MNLSIRGKIITGFTISVLVCMFLGFYSCYSIYRISELSAKQETLRDANSEIASVLTAHYSWRQNLTVAVLNNSSFSGSYDPNTCALGKWKNSDAASVIHDYEITNLLSQIDAPHALIHTQAEQIINIMKEGNTEEAHKIFNESILPNADNVISLLSKMTDRYSTILDEHINESTAYESSIFVIIIVIVVVACLLIVLIEVIVVESILRPLKRLTNAASSVAMGNFNVNFKYSINDEIGKLTNSFTVLVDTFKSMITDMNEMASNHSAGDMDYIMSSDRYEGEFKNVINGTNNMIIEYIDTVKMILNIAQKYADGDFSARLEKLPGKKAVANNILNTVADNLKNVEVSIKYLLNSAIAGELDKRIDESSFTGDWKDIIVGMNNLLRTVDEPLVEAEKVLTLVSDGKLDANITGKYNGRFKSVSSAINKTVEVLSMYILDISNALNELASDNFNIVISKEYYGNFSHIKKSLVAIIDRLNNVMHEIGGAADQVASGASQISQSSMHLSEGASEQASAVEELNATIDLIYAQANKNAEYSTSANTLSLTTKDNAMRGNNEMSDMLKSMTEINAASQNISKIIKVIDEIAFQTNLLALNAAVEAARAGEHGKGFAVVAEEVRSLAARTSSAAKETTELIEHTISKINEGAKIADNTAVALNKIVEGVASVSDIINEIEISSKTQTSSISQINEGIKQISTVTQQNSATSEESAAAAEELNGQSDMLKNMIDRFKLQR